MLCCAKDLFVGANCWNTMRLLDGRPGKHLVAMKGEMPRTYLIFGDIEGKLDTLCVECTKCSRKGRYSVHKLIEKYGRKANMMEMEGTA